MCLKKIFEISVVKLLIIFLFLTSSIKGGEKNDLKIVMQYFNNHKEFSSSFLQIHNNEISEGLIFFKQNRIRIEYISPSNLIFVLKKNKGMYFNKDLKEVEYFNPKETIGEFLIDLFNDKSFLLNSTTNKGEAYFYIQKKIQLSDTEYEVKIYFEEKPLQLKKIEVNSDLEAISFTVLNLNYNPDLKDKIFSLANPLLS